MALLTKRTTVLGLPVGPKKMAWGRIAKAGGAIVLVAAGQQGRQKLEGLTAQFKEPLEQGKETLESAQEAGEQVSGIASKFSGNGGGGGMLSKAASVIPGVGGGGGNGGGGDDGGSYTKKLRLVTKLAQDVAVPRSVAYNQWTQYEDFPEFMKGVISVEPEDPVTQKWTVKIGPSRRQFTGEVAEQVPDERIQWKGSEGTEHYGVVTFHELDENLTRVQIEMEYYPQGFIEKVGNIFLAARRKARKDLRLFKHYMELENEETGSWRGEISESEVVDEGEEEQAEGAEEEQAEGAEEQAAEAEGDGKERAEKERAESGGGKGNGGRDKSASRQEASSKQGGEKSGDGGEQRERQQRSSAS